MYFDLKSFKKADLSETMVSGNGDIQPVVKINDNQITFNRAFIKAINNAGYIEMMVDINSQQVAFIGLDKPTRSSRRFYHQKSKNKVEKVNSVYWTGKVIRHFFDTTFKRKPGTEIKLFGKKYDNAIVFSMKKVAFDPEKEFGGLPE